ncbi:flagellar protein FlaF [Halovenus aranensis]|jgi:flagellar protein FlaF|uniref:Flagellar protein FlaF n=1 Tax=Halovenus aranensis TaxID=890420 RepID=A0A1G8RMX1_9EURY|nr:hypothetical protein [Halovenus aranensis]SDJ18414.1 flagellar protein FlaF [Halovenus aranensis]
MGFSVSGAAALIFLSLFIAFGALYTATDNSFQQVTDAQDDRTDRALETKNTALELSSAVYDTGADELTVTANNTGATTLSLNATSLLIDNSFQTNWEANASVDGNGETDLWLPGETVTITLNTTSQPASVSLTAPSGISASAEVTT